MFIKICGITSLSAVAAAVECAVDAIGFVFAPSSRRLTPAQAAELSESVPRELLRVAVTQHPTQAEIDEICERVRPDWLQTDVEDIAGLRIPAGVTVIPVLRAGRALPPQLPQRCVFEGPVSGRGATSDWSQAAELADGRELILAGGLNATNVAAAIARVQPFGVDVSSGVERAPGVKDARRMAEFVTAVRQAVRAAHH